MQNEIGALQQSLHMEKSSFKVRYLQEWVPLDQQVLDLFGHGVKHQLQVHTRLQQLLPLKRQHHARVLGHLWGQFIRSGNWPVSAEDVRAVQTRCREASVFKPLPTPPHGFHNNDHVDRLDMSSGERHMSGGQGVHASTWEGSLTPPDLWGETGTKKAAGQHAVNVIQTCWQITCCFYNGGNYSQGVFLQSEIYSWGREKEGGLWQRWRYRGRHEG